MKNTILFHPFIRRIEGEWYCLEEHLLYTIHVKDERNIILRNITEGCIDECMVSSFSFDKESIRLITKYEGHWHIQIFDEDTIIMQFGINEYSEGMDVAKPLVFKRS